MIDELTLSAWHEARHAVAYLDMRRRFRYVTLRPRTPGVTALVQVRPRRIDTLTPAVIAQTGPMAQGRYSLGTYSPGELETEGLEPEDVMFGACLYGGHGDHEIIKAAGPGAAEISEQIAGSILDRRWPVVERLAAALPERHTLSYADAARLANVEAS